MDGVFVKPAKDLAIQWGQDARYWKWEHETGSWFAQSASLQNVCWLEVRGELEGSFAPRAYTASFRLKFAENLYGWSRTPVKLSLSTSNGDHIESQCFLDGRINSEVANSATLRSLPSTSWMELDIGEFVVPREMPVKLNFCMMEIEGGHWKQGLVLDCVKIQPTSTISRDVGRSSSHFEGRTGNARRRNTHVD